MQVPLPCLCLVPLLPTAHPAARTHFYEEQQANLTRETQPRALSWLWVHFKPKTQSQFRFLNFPILVHIAVVEQDLAELVQVHPANAGLQAKQKNTAKRENSSGFPQPCTAAGRAAAGKSTQGGEIKQPDSTSVHMRWGSEQGNGEGAPCKSRKGMGLYGNATWFLCLVKAISVWPISNKSLQKGVQYRSLHYWTCAFIWFPLSNLLH